MKSYTVTLTKDEIHILSSLLSQNREAMFKFVRDMPDDETGNAIFDAYNAKFKPLAAKLDAAVNADKLASAKGEMKK